MIDHQYKKWKKDCTILIIEAPQIFLTGIYKLFSLFVMVAAFRDIDSS